MNDLPIRQRIARQATYTAILLGFLALLGILGHIETSGLW